MIKTFLCIILLSTLIFSCRSEQKDQSTHKHSAVSQFEISADTKTLKVLFSHNINGETHPCGCRQFPLGGFAPLAGLMHEISSQESVQTLYLDTGNTFFPSTVVPSHVRDSLLFKAEAIAHSLKLVDLAFFTPGAQDFAAGQSFLSELLKKHEITSLTANLPQNTFSNQKKWAVLNHNDHKIFLVGLVTSNHLPRENQLRIAPMKDTLRDMLSEIKQQGFDPDNNKHRLLVLSTSGINFDVELAQEFPQIDWIIGSHTQSFLNRPRVVNGVRIVQVLSRNHYLGEISLDLTKGKEFDDYRLLEVSESKAKSLEPNPLEAFLKNHLKELADVQLAEQERMGSSFSSEHQLIPTSASCIECHTPQAQKWMETTHSMAFWTLKKAGEPNNLSCVECHSVGLNDPHGFQRSQDLVLFSNQLGQNEVEEQTLLAMRDKYWAAIEEEFDEIDSVRALSPRELRKHSSRWMEIDRDHQVAHNFSGVQCMNCHNQELDHPFDFGTPAQSYEQKREVMKNNCLACHDADQSPGWYIKDEQGLAVEVDHTVLKEMIEKIACPSLEND